MNVEEENVKKLLNLMEDGKQMEFFNTWKSAASDCSIQNDPAFKHLTFYIHIYFIVKKIKSTQKEVNRPNEQDNDPMKLFKDYLWNNGSYFSCETEFIPYFVLPFTHEPQKNVMFCELFQDSWEVNLKKKITSFLTEAKSSNPENYISSAVDENLFEKDRLQVEINYWKIEYDSLRKKFDDLYDDTELSMGITTELLAALEKFVSGEEIDLKLTLNKCNKMNFTLFNKNSIKTEKLHLSDEYQRILQNHKQNNITFTVRSLDIEKLKSDLLTASVKTKLLILQALRWGITKHNSIESHLLMWLISEHDVLHLMSEGTNFIKDMLLPTNINTPHPTQQSIARLINVIAAFKVGQNYLAASPVVEILIEAIHHKDVIRIDEATENMLISSLQTLSGIHDIGEKMIEHNLIQWLVKKLLTLNEWNYQLKYSLLLLMSLTRYRRGKAICIEMQSDLLQFLRHFLSGNYKHTESCESVFWKYCAFLEKILTQPNLTIVDWHSISYKFTSDNVELLCKYFNRFGVKEEISTWEPEVEADDPLKVEPNGIEFLRINYSYMYE